MPRKKVVEGLSEPAIEQVEPVSVEKTEEPKKVERPVLVKSAKKFQMFQVGEGFQIKNDAGQVISPVVDELEAEKLFREFTR